MNENCRIGQKQRCARQGCEWKKLFYLRCNGKNKPVEHKTNVLPSRQTKKALNEDLGQKIKIETQDNWIAKIKVVK